MQFKASKKHIWICLLVCSLFFAYGAALFHFSSDGYALNSAYFTAGAEQSSMTGAASLWHGNDPAITGISAELFISAMKHSQGLLFKVILSILTWLITARIICLIYSSRLAGSLCSQFDSIRITLFLHKKDGMK